MRLGTFVNMPSLCDFPYLCKHSEPQVDKNKVLKGILGLFQIPSICQYPLVSVYFSENHFSNMN